jgi:outer membrane receptor protein involved in Fe transport
MGRRFKNNGWLYGPIAYLPQGRTQVIEGDTMAVYGDSSAVSLNSRDRWSGQASLKLDIANSLKLRIDALGSTEKRRNYNHFWRLNPTGDRGDDEAGISVISKLTHILTKTTFHELTFAYKYNELQSNLYDDSFDSRYVHSDSTNTGALQFVKAGTDLNRFERNSRSLIFKWDLTSQLTRRHQVKTGVEIQYDRVFYQDINLVPKEDENGQQIVPFEPYIEPVFSPRHDKFTRKPYKFAVYIQDKIEYESLIINAGLRFDLFDANGRIAVDPEDPNIYSPFKLQHTYKDLDGDGIISLEEQREDNEYTLEEKEAFWWKETSIKTQLSPRLGVAYPITERGVIHFSYGIFQQLPDYYLLYVEDELKVTSAAGLQGPFGNPDLNPQRTTMYELGLKQQLTENLAIDVTGFYRDIRDWISTSPPIETVLSGVTYSRNINRDFANVRGITLAVDRRFADHFAFNLDYTYQIAEGTNSDPAQEFFAQDQGDEPTRILTPLNWDQRHALNASFFIGAKDWGISLIGRYNSGQPYTPTLVTATRTGQTILAGLRENSRQKPNQFIIDLMAYKDINIGPVDVQLFARVFNLLDSKSPVNVWGDTGEVDFTLQITQAAQADPSWFIRPDYYSEPRRIQIGTKISFK